MQELAGKEYVRAKNIKEPVKENPYVLADGLKLLFTNYFGEDYQEFTEINENKPLLSQIVESYQQYEYDFEVEKSIHELSTLISKGYSEAQLKNEILPKLGFALPVSVAKLGGAYQVFLELLYEKLKGKSFN